MRVIFTGGRTFKNESAVVDMLMQIDSTHVIVHGGAKGLDSIADKYAREMGFEVEVYKADWGTHGRSAGPIRNRQMADLDDVAFVVAFEGGRGTSNMVGLAKSKGIPVMEVRP